MHEFCCTGHGYSVLCPEELDLISVMREIDMPEKFVVEPGEDELFTPIVELESN